jgi:hypothetical protein
VAEYHTFPLPLSKIQAVFSDLTCGLRIEEKYGKKKGGGDVIAAAEWREAPPNQLRIAIENGQV